MWKPTHLNHYSLLSYNVTFVDLNVDNALFFSKQQYAVIPYKDYQYAH